MPIPSAFDSPPTHLIYMAHPFGGDPSNLLRAKRWLRWLSRTFTDYFFVVPWIPLCEVLDDADWSERHRSIRGDCRTAQMCSAVVLVGGRISSGMLEEALAVNRYDHPVFDLTWMGSEPPALPEAAQL